MLLASVDGRSYDDSWRTWSICTPYRTTRNTFQNWPYDWKSIYRPTLHEHRAVALFELCKTPDAATPRFVRQPLVLHSSLPEHIGS